MPKPATRPCPCGKTAAKRLLSYADCCGRYIEDYENTPAPDAEGLMRSRYSAFVLEREAYLIATWDPSTRPASVALDPDMKWLGLSIRDSTVTGPDTAEVEFVARSRFEGRGQRMHERSRFIRREDRWFYVDGDMLA
jgi:SEC-C motif-containing protein